MKNIIDEETMAKSEKQKKHLEKLNANQWRRIAWVMFSVTYA